MKRALWSLGGWNPGVSSARRGRGRGGRARGGGSAGGGSEGLEGGIWWLGGGGGGWVRRGTL